ncbi:hypothetical protein ABZ729_27790 [Streptomyces sp. NPDC006678]
MGDASWTVHREWSMAPEPFVRAARRRHGRKAPIHGATSLNPA